jgi:putative membrane protein insertion efficiency factor
VKKIVIFLIDCYKYFLSPIIGINCRFTPSCSEYTKLSIIKYGTLCGLYKGAKRILRCNPLCKGGEDYP